MANTKITDLTLDATPLATDEIPVNQGGLDRKVTVATLQTPWLQDIDSNSFMLGFDTSHGINDESGNEQLWFITTGSAVNYFTITNAATGAAPEFAVAGSDTDIPIKLSSKGAGQVQFAIDDTNEVILTTAALSPASSDGTALGTTALMWSDLFLAAASVVNFNNGDVTVTHGTNTLTFAGASSGYILDAALLPSADDAAALGSAAASWSDVFVASGGVINFANGDVTITHASNTLTFAAATTGYVFSNGPVTAPTYITPDAGELTISSGAITVTAGNHTVDTESDASTDDLITIDGGANGMHLFLRAAHTDRTIELTSGGNIVGTKSLTSTSMVAHLIYDLELTAWIIVNQ